MFRLHARLAVLIFLSILTLLQPGLVNASGMVKGIYITQETLEDTKYITYLINRAKKVGIHSFIVDLEQPSAKYKTNIQLLQKNGIAYVARIIVFPNNGGKPAEVLSEAYWEKKYKLVKYALAYGASQIQLDYIRYNSKQRPSTKNAEDILRIIRWFKTRINVPLQIDVFGISSFGPSRYIGQDIKLFSKSVDTICPMVYPSHYEPFRVHAVKPYDTVYSSLQAIRQQFNNKPLPFKLIPYIEQSNYRYPLSRQKKLAYLYAQIQAAEKANADGWYVWSPHNYYDSLFQVLETHNVR
jgi:hypothetical protein